MRSLQVLISAAQGKKHSVTTEVTQVKGTSKEVTFELRPEWQEKVSPIQTCRLSFPAGVVARSSLQRKCPAFPLESREGSQGCISPTGHTLPLCLCCMYRASLFFALLTPTLFALYFEERKMKN